MELPCLYTKLSRAKRKSVREEYVKQQNGLCMWCEWPLDGEPPVTVTSKNINWKWFPPGFLNNPVHLQHNHDTDLTEGAVHAYCNAVMWQYHHR